MKIATFQVVQNVGPRRVVKFSTSVPSMYESFLFQVSFMCHIWCLNFDLCFSDVTDAVALCPVQQLVSENLPKPGACVNETGLQSEDQALDLEE